MSEKPILFNTAMVRAILAGKKTETRRLVKAQIPEMKYASTRGMHGDYALFTIEPHFYTQRKTAYKPGDVLYVRETWNGLRTGPKGAEETTYWYRADEDDDKLNPDDIWRPSIHMPKAAARIWLEVTNVRIERLRDITQDGARHEGVDIGYTESLKKVPAVSAREAFMRLWDTTIKPDQRGDLGWQGNPWVFVYEFKRINV